MPGVEPYDHVAVVVWSEVDGGDYDVLMLNYCLLAEPARSSLKSEALQHGLISEHRSAIVVGLLLEPLVCVEKANKWEVL